MTTVLPVMANGTVALMKSTYPGQALILLSLRVLQPLHQLGVSEQISVQWAVLGQGELCRVLRQRGALIMTLYTRAYTRTHTRTHTRTYKCKCSSLSIMQAHYTRTQSAQMP